LGFAVPFTVVPLWLITTHSKLDQLNGRIHDCLTPQQQQIRLAKTVKTQHVQGCTLPT
jgi:D-alanyl-D-alanine dipeptidase